MRRTSNIILSLSLFSLFSALPSNAQNATFSPPRTSNAARTTEKSPAEIAITKQVDELEKLRRLGAYDEVIRVVNEAVEAAQAELEQKAKAAQELGLPQAEAPETEGELRPVIDGRLYYKRAQAEESIGWYEGASNDMEMALQAMPKEATEALRRLKNIGEACPPNFYDMKDGDEIVFRVYYDSDNPIAQEIIQTLPRAVKINAQVLGITVTQQPVFVFDTADRMRAFFAARSLSPNAPAMDASWAWARGGVAGLYFCLEKPTGESMVQKLIKNPDSLRNTVAHELNHTLLARGMGTVKMPQWFKEGLASTVGTSMIGDNTTYLKAMGKLLAGQALLSPDQLEARNSFVENVEVAIVEGKINQGTGRVAANPYGQAQHMVRFLLSNMRKGELIDFLNQVREQRSFDGGLQAQFRMTTAEFYEAWYRSLFV